MSLFRDPQKLTNPPIPIYSIARFQHNHTTVIEGDHAMEWLNHYGISYTKTTGLSPEDTKILSTIIEGITAKEPGPIVKVALGATLLQISKGHTAQAAVTGVSLWLVRYMPLRPTGVRIHPKVREVARKRLAYLFLRESLKNYFPEYAQQLGS